MSAQKPLIVVDVSALCLRIVAVVFFFLAFLDVLWTVVAVSEHGILSVAVAFSLGRYRFPLTALVGLLKGLFTVVLLFATKLLIKTKPTWEKESWQTFNVFWTVTFVAIAALFLTFVFLLSQVVLMWALL